MPLQIIRNDITKVVADAIVNTANPRPVIGNGTDSAIHAAAGPELLAARQEIGDIAVGCAVATPAFGLPAKYVLHTVSPSWIDGAHGEEELLLAAYRAALAEAERLGCGSVAFPLLSAGCYAFPNDIALSVALRAFTDHLLEHDLNIILVLFSSEAFGLAGSVFDDLKSYIDDNYVDARLIAENVRYSFGDDSMPDYPASLRPNTAKPNKRHGFFSRFRPKKEETETAAQPADAEDSVRFSEVEEDETSGAAGPSASHPLEAEGAIAYDAACMPSARFSMGLDEILKQHESTFSEYLTDLIDERGLTNPDVYKRAEVSKQLFSKIISNKDYQPTKNTVLQLAIGLQLDVPQTRALLRRAGYALTRSSKTDLVVQYYIERQIYNVTFINAALDDCGLPLLKTGLKA